MPQTLTHPLTGMLRIIGGMVLGILAVASPAASGEDPASTLGKLYDVARLTDATVLDLNMLLGEEKSPAYKQRLDETLKNLEAAQKASAAALASSGIRPAESAALAGSVAAFIKLAHANRDTTLKTGTPEGAVIDEMMLQRKEARKSLDPIYADLEKAAGVAGSPLSEARALALLLQQMSALYVESASSAGGVSYRTQDADEATIDALARNFDARVTKMLAKAKGDEAGKRVRSIEAKWRFIQKSMLNYREKTVPFLVDRYTQAIVADLMALAAVLEKK